MATLTISKANPIHFRIETDTVGGINENGVFPDNYLYPDITTFFNCEGMPMLDGIGTQVYNCTDTTDIQVDFDSTGMTNPGLILRYRDSDGILGENVIPTTPYTGQSTYHNFNLDFSVPKCDKCYDLEISSYEIDTGLTVLWGDNGTFENAGTWNSNWTPNGNARAQDGVIFQGGAFSAKMTAGGAPVAADGKFCEVTSSFTLTAHRVYTLAGYIYDDGTNSFTVDGNLVRWVITGLSDYTIISETTVTPSVDGRDQWHQVSITFATGAQTNAFFTLQHQTAGGTLTAPQASGIIYTDTHTLSRATEYLEATSEAISLCDDNKCTVLVEYYGDNPQFNLYYDDNDYAARMRYRVDMRMAKFKFEDEDQNNYKKSDGTFQAIASYPTKIYTGEAFQQPPYMAEIVELSSLHDNFTIDGLTYSRNDSEFSPEWSDDGHYCAFEVDLKLSGYDYDKSLCS
jgi:hypothetical protein